MAVLAFLISGCSNVTKNEGSSIQQWCIELGTIKDTWQLLSMVES
jgi:hypothetical protein